LINHAVSETPARYYSCVVVLSLRVADVAEAELEKAGLKRLAVRLEKGIQNADGRGFGDLHIDAGHGAQIRNIVDENGDPVFSDLAEYAQFVGENWTEVRKGHKGRLLLVVRDASRTARRQSPKAMVIEVKSTSSSDFYTIINEYQMENRGLEKFDVILKKGRK